MSNLINGLAISAMISLFSMSGMASAASVNYVVNSDFEESELKPNAWKVFSEINGWTTTKSPEIEVQNGNVGGSTAYSGNQNVELDSHGNSGMSQKLKLDAGDYFLSFAYRGRTDAPDTNSITYSFLRTGIPKDTVKGVSSEAWQVFDFHSTLADATTITLKFKATGTSDAVGGYLDPVRITGVPIPPAVWLFGSALMGLVGVARHQTAKV